jgi:hypothetical protein
MTIARMSIAMLALLELDEIARRRLRRATPRGAASEGKERT